MSSGMLVADIGGTNARFALATRAQGRVSLSRIENLRCADYGSVEAALAKYLEQSPTRPAAAAVAVAGPVRDGKAQLTNLGWDLSVTSLCAAGGFTHAVLLNDFAALGLAAGHLADEDLVRVGPELVADARGSIAVVGPGTGFGVTALVRDERGQAVVSGEGGHVSFCPQDELEVELWRVLQRQFGRVSVERILCGPGLLNLYRALREVEAAPDARDYGDAAGIVQAAQAGDALCEGALQRFGMILGSVAGDFALAYGATGGVVLAGGMAPLLQAWIARGGFRERFEDKGRLSHMVRRIPTHILVHPQAALLGAAWALPDVGS